MILDLPALTTPLLKETLFIYLAASGEIVSAMLLVVRKGKQHPVHYVSRTLHDTEQNYAPLEKLALALPHVSRMLRRYFEAYHITVITGQPIKKILSKADTSGKLAQYFVELGAYNIIEEWVLYIDGASSVKGSGVGMILISPTKTEYTYALRLNFESTNNEAEYKALLAGLRIAKKMGVRSLSVNVDSKLVASQLNDNYEAFKENMIRYLSKAKEYINCFENFKIKNIPRNKNQKADVLSKLASVAFNHLTKEILVETLDTPSMDIEEINAIVEEEEGETWMTPIINCLERGIWPEDQNKARALRMKIGQFVMEKGVLFKTILPNAYAPVCGPITSQLRHTRNTYGGIQHEFESKVGGGKSHPARILLANDAPGCKGRNTQWGMDVLGPLSEVSGRVKFVIVAIDYFTKWIEAKAMAKTTGKETMMIKEGEGNEEEMRLNLDLLQERREESAI
ncbi:reverse transcriptase domain-containing protein [Tanacetum coccineum]